MADTDTPSLEQADVNAQPTGRSISADDRPADLVCRSNAQASPTRPTSHQPYRIPAVIWDVVTAGACDAADFNRRSDQADNRALTSYALYLARLQAGAGDENAAYLLAGRVTRRDCAGSATPVTPSTPPERCSTSTPPGTRNSSGTASTQTEGPCSRRFCTTARANRGLLTFTRAEHCSDRMRFFQRS